ncbi:MAG TPA: hypothetical protein VNI35_04000, partial [Nitrospira sp.]|nr:hypothetical protein [Nitrospira sp.]
MKTVIRTQALKTALCVITAVFTIAANTALAQNTAERQKNTAVRNENVEVLIQGGPLPNLNGLDFGPDGNLWGASVVTPAIVAINPETGQIVKRLTWNDGVKSPDDLHWGPDGSLFWVNIIHGEVVRRYPNGTTKILAKLSPGPDGITLSDDGRRLFVGDCFMANKLYEIDPDGNKAPRVITDKLGQLAAFNAMDWGPDGKLYGPRWFEGAVARLDPDSGKFEDIESGLGVAAAVKFDRRGQLYALSAIGRVWRLNPSDGTKELIASLPAALDNFA